MKENKRKILAFNTLTLITTVVVIAIAIVFNVIFANSIIAQIDLTPSRDFSMSPEAREELRNVTREVEIVGLFDGIRQELFTPSVHDRSFFTDLYLRGRLVEGTFYHNHLMSMFGGQLPFGEGSLAPMNIPAVMGVLREFEGINSNIRVSYVDIHTDPLFVTNFLGPNSNVDPGDFRRGDFIVRSGNIAQRVTSRELSRNIATERYDLPFTPNIDGGFLSAILYVTADRRPVIGLPLHHDQDNIMEDINYSELRDGLERNVFTLRTMDRLIDNLDDIDILMMINPRVDITVPEADLLVRYLDNGGNLFLAMDPDPASPDFNNLNRVLEWFNLRINNDIIEASGSQTVGEGADSYMQFQVGLSVNEVLTGVVVERIILDMPSARSITFLNIPSEVDTTHFIQTDREASAANFDTGESRVGIQNIASASALSRDSGSKVIVLGSAAMLSNQFIGLERQNDTVASAVDMTVRICAWMEQSIDFILPIKRANPRNVSVPLNSANVLGWVSMIAIPGLIFGVGTVVWLRRRHL